MSVTRCCKISNIIVRQLKNNFDKILICGDIAFSGAEEEYIRANKFINELCAIVDCKKTEVYTVPGNHDKNVNVSPKKVREFFHQAMCDLSGKHNWWWQEMYKEDFPFVKKLYAPLKITISFVMMKGTMLSHLCLMH